ncbi:MAG: cobalt ECF transporter T component CbiQ [Candidatus Freyarchaeota archaeon]|nr:cobalt ECF transporter T component CbiQ [Candidatus Jordarchaeia archaeon]MBS7269132.1 cobalt ECF transporter T component CbiQ [Candidatus Jordarchaeia archaeon]MBS7279167.1 cobalt ECF transporter T component CbiQ [Candidatus Jordarchaeia archaeon]
MTFFRDTLLTEKSTSIDSPVHRLDPRVKLLSLVAIIFCAVALENAVFFGALLVLLLVLVLISRIPLKLYLAKASFIPLFSLIIVLPIPFIVSGNPLTFIHLYGYTYLTVSFEGLYRAIVFVLRVWVATGSAILLISTTKFSSIVMALRKLGVPEIFASLLLITYRYIFLFAGEALFMVQARNMRSFGKESILQRIRVVGQMIGSLFIRAYERGEQVYYAMLSRGYTGKMDSFRSQKMKKKDAAFLALVLALVFVLIFVDLAAYNFTIFNYSHFTFLVIDFVMKKMYAFTDFSRSFWGLLVA